MLKDGVSIKNEQFGFPESHYPPILDAVERIEVNRVSQRGAAKGHLGAVHNPDRVRVKLAG